MLSWCICVAGVGALAGLNARFLWHYARQSNLSPVVLYLYIGGCSAVGLLSLWGLVRAWRARSADWLTGAISVIAPGVVVLSGAATLVTAPIGLLALAIILHADAGKGPGDIA